MTYVRKLSDPRWQRVRLKVMDRDSWRCQATNCRSPVETPLHVHHKYYLPNFDPWEYPLDSLITFCEKCHEAQHAKPEARRVLVEGEFYRWRELPSLLGFEPRGYLTQDAGGIVQCGCFRLDYNPDAPDIILPGREGYIAKQALAYAKQKNFVPVFVNAGDFGWEYCGQFRVETVTFNAIEIAIHGERAKREGTIAMVLFLEKEH